MKYLIQALAILILLISVSMLQSCMKKGEDDPLLSFRTRMQRLTGEWKLASYSNDISREILQEINFNQIVPCDTAEETGTSILNLTVTNDLSGSGGVGEIRDQIGSEGGIKEYNLTGVVYDLSISKDGTYSVVGSYEYYDDIAGKEVEGGFANYYGRWYWEEGKRCKDAISFTNFPIFDVSAIDETGAPIVMQDNITLDMPRLSNKEVKFNDRRDGFLQEVITSDTYLVPNSIDSLAECTKITNIRTTDNHSMNFTFTKKTESDTTNTDG